MNFLTWVRPGYHAVRERVADQERLVEVGLVAGFEVFLGVLDHAVDEQLDRRLVLLALHEVVQDHADHHADERAVEGFLHELRLQQLFERLLREELRTRLFQLALDRLLARVEHQVVFDGSDQSG